jgi:hypothetical protein
MMRRLAVNTEARHCKKCESGHRNAAGGEPADDPPVDAAIEAVHQRPDALCRRRVEQIGADSGRWLNAEEHDKQRGHQRASANPGHTDEQTDAKPRDRKD